MVATVAISLPMNPTSDGVKTLAMLGFGAADVARSFGIHVEARLLQMLSREGKVLIEIHYCPVR